MVRFTRIEVRRAVADPEWQRFRHSLRGLSTFEKLLRLRSYVILDQGDDLAITIRVDNYIKALCRGGQLEPGSTYELLGEDEDTWTNAIRR